MDQVLTKHTRIVSEEKDGWGKRKTGTIIDTGTYSEIILANTLPKCSCLTIVITIPVSARAVYN